VRVHVRTQARACVFVCVCSRARMYTGLTAFMSLREYVCIRVMDDHTSYLDFIYSVQRQTSLAVTCVPKHTLTHLAIGLQTVGNDPGFKPPSLQVQMMPVPAFRPGATNTQLLVSLSMMIALAPLAYFIAVTLVTEKKTWARVMFKVMGVSDGAFW